MRSCREIETTLALPPKSGNQNITQEDMNTADSSMANSRTADEVTTNEILELEGGALRRWLSGDPSGFLEISANDVVYFDPFTERRLNGLVELTPYYEAIRGKIHADRFEILNPLVQLVGGAAILTFNFISYGGNENAMCWNCTEAYRRNDDQWRIIQTHWSFTKVK